MAGDNETRGDVGLWTSLLTLPFCISFKNVFETSFGKKRFMDLEEIYLVLLGAFLLAIFYIAISFFIKNIRETQSRVLRQRDEEHQTLLPTS